MVVAVIYGLLTIVIFIGGLMVVCKAGSKDNLCNYGQVGEDSDFDR